MRVPVHLSPLEAEPLVSVLVANYNYREYVEECIGSVLAQDYPHFEVVVCDDGSTDGSPEVISKLAATDERIRLFAKENGGQASALNRAFSESRGDPICILDADDLFLPGKIRSVVEVLRREPDCGIATHDMVIVDSNGRRRGAIRPEQDGYLGPEIATLRLGLPMPLASGISFRREVVARICPLPEETFRSVADWALAYAAAFVTHTTRIPGVLSGYRVHGANLSGTTSTSSSLEPEALEKTLHGMERVLGYVNEFTSTELGLAVDSSRVRNVLEHRLMLGVLRGDRAMTDAASTDLRDAYREVRRDYPAYRYAFWQTLSALPSPVSRWLLQAAFQGFRLSRRAVAP